MKKNTIQAAIMKPEEFSLILTPIHTQIHSLTHTHTHTHTHTDTSNIQSSLAPTADDSITKPVTISRLSNV